MKHFSYFLCPGCGSVTVSSSIVSISCCDSCLKALRPAPVDGSAALPARRDGDELIVTLSRPMLKESYIAFIALESWDGVIVRKLFPEWNEDVILPWKKGRMVWAMSTGEAYSQKIG